MSHKSSKFTALHSNYPGAILAAAAACGQRHAIDTGNFAPIIVDCDFLALSKDKQIYYQQQIIDTIDGW